jgi:hypothetical protein
MSSSLRFTSNDGLARAILREGDAYNRVHDATTRFVLQVPELEVQGIKRLIDLDHKLLPLILISGMGNVEAVICGYNQCRQLMMLGRRDWLVLTHYGVL